jgi:D-alanyl-D-alanine carboxypeptidase/D-alanyl-D-alanine-endopeptidase (penicillin-binding protein 4)
LNRSYACEVSGLNYNANCVKINAKKVGKSVALSITPPTTYVKLVNKVKTSKKANAVGAWRNSVPNKLIVKGYCKTESGFDVAIERPAAFFAYLLAERLAKAGIEIKGDFAEMYIKKDKSIRTLRTYTTNIADVLTRCNADSFGLAAEALIKTVSAENTMYRINGEWPHGLTLAKRYLRSTGVKDAEFTLTDGSGLSRQNKLSPNALTSVLLDIYKGPNRKYYIDTLAVGGVKGSRPVRAYFTDKKYKGKVFAKSGTLNGVKALSGICRTDSGDRIFSIITNKANSKTRQAINDIVEAIFP